MSGHQERIDDLDRIAALGIRTLRYPAIWERIERSPGLLDWRWTDERLERLRTLGIDPILTLLHHGSGPRGTDLLDPAFPERFARFAGRVAQRYPHIARYTPVNEPVTTARFSALYGHWYPHARDTRAFFRAVWHQVRAIQLAMRAIRQVNPNAVCVLTDDYGAVHSTRPLRYQAGFENHRRWIGLDLLFGKVSREHPLRGFLLDAGIDERALDAMAAEPTDGAIIGIDYYLTSERFLDHRLERYPTQLHGGNGQHAYVDVEAVRARTEGIQGAERMLQEIWNRYGYPVAITEAFLGRPWCDRVRWVQSIWEAAAAARAGGADVRAVTSWALLGSFEWDSLVTRQTGGYEAGAFDVLRPGQPETDLARWIRATAAGYPIPVATPGWWETDARFLYPPTPALLEPAALRHESGHLPEARSAGS